MVSVGIWCLYYFILGATSVVSSSNAKPIYETSASSDAGSMIDDRIDRSISKIRSTNRQVFKKTLSPENTRSRSSSKTNAPPRIRKLNRNNSLTNKERVKAIYDNMEDRIESMFDPDVERTHSRPPTNDNKADGVRNRRIQVSKVRYYAKQSAY